MHERKNERETFGQMVNSKKNRLMVSMWQRQTDENMGASIQPHTNKQLRMVKKNRRIFFAFSNVGIAQACFGL